MLQIVYNVHCTHAHYVFMFDTFYYDSLIFIINFTEQLVLSSTGPSTDDRVLRSGGSGLRATDDLLSQKRKRKPLTDEQLEERRKKV